MGGILLPVIADVFVVKHRTGIVGETRHAPSDVEQGAAAEKNDPVDMTRTIRRQTGFDIGVTGLGCTPEKTAPNQGLESIEPFDSDIGDDQGPLHTTFDA